MAENSSKLRIGRRQVFYKGIDMGLTLDGVVLNVGREFKEVVADKYGSTPIDYALTGNSLSATVKLAQVDYNSWKFAVPESSDVDSTSDRVNFGADAGALLRGDAGLLVLHKPENALSDDSEDYTIYKAVSTEPVEIPFKVDEQSYVEITFTGLVDESYDSGRRLGHYGPASVS